jgi:serine/threonine protein kinase
MIQSLKRYGEKMNDFKNQFLEFFAEPQSEEKNPPYLVGWDDVDKKMLNRGSGGLVWQVNGDLKTLEGQSIDMKNKVVKEIVSKRFLRELKNCSHLQQYEWKGSLNVVFVDVVHKFVVFKERMEMDLMDYYDQGRINPEDLKFVVFHLCKSVQELHHRNIYHLDIKPENALIDLKTKHIRLCDFAFASLTKYLSTVQGTPEYLAPEVLNNALYLAPKVDIYGLGATIYFLYVGDFAYSMDKCKTSDQMYRAKLKSLTFPKGTWDPILQNLLRKMMHSYPSERPSIDKIISEWKTFCKW